MYDAVTRSTYAALVKTAETKVPARLHLALLKVAARSPSIRDALVASMVASKVSPITKEKH